MEYVSLTGTGLRVSKVCVGTMTFGGQVPEDESIRIIHAALDKGINFVDTADLYYTGVSETVTGKALKGRRDSVILATKVFNPMSQDPNDKGLSRRHILDAAEKSLKRMQTDYVDIYYLHQPDYQTPIEETLSAMDMLVRSGKVRYVGVSNYSAWQIADMQALARAHGMTAPVVTQNVYNLLTRGIEDELLPYARSHNMGVLVYNPLMSGMLTGKFSAKTPIPGTRLNDWPAYKDRYWCQENLDAAERLSALATKYGMSPVSLALSWCATRSGITGVILGMSKAEHLDQNIAAAMAPEPPAEVLAECDAIWKGMPVGSRFRYYR